jgi:hypothetical protein
VPSQLLERRPDIAAAERRVASSNARIGVAKAAYYPNLDLGAGGGLESDALGELATVNSSFWNAGPSAGEILYDAGRRHAHVQLAVSQRGQATADYRQRVLVAFQEVEDNLAALRVLETEAGTEQAAVTAARNSVALSTARYKRGLSSYLEILTNQTVALTDERAWQRSPRVASFQAFSWSWRLVVGGIRRNFRRIRIEGGPVWIVEKSNCFRENGRSSGALMISVTSSSCMRGILGTPLDGIPMRDWRSA